MTVDEFKKEIGREVLAEFCEIHGNFYGTHKGKLRDVIERGKVIVMAEIDLHSRHRFERSREDS